MSAPAKVQAMEALIDAHARELHLPTVRARFRTLAEETTRDQQPPVAYLAALLEAEVSERAERRERRRLIDAKFPITKHLEDFRFEENPKIPKPRSPRWRRAPGSMIASRSSSLVTAEPARHIWRSASRYLPASKDAASSSPPSRPWRTSCKQPRADESSAKSSPATPEPNWSSLTSWDISHCPRAPRSWSSRSSPSATSERR